MDALKFTLSGRNAFFKKPEVNTYCYFTYGQIHKVALLGLLGAVAGYDGYGQKEWTRGKGGKLTWEYPEFYEKLRNIKVSIVPENGQGYIPKKIQLFNNSVGYASGEKGGNLIVREQWLENPVWNIYILLDCPEAEKIQNCLENGTCVYTPYLGKNDHPADIRNVQKVKLQTLQAEKTEISSMYPKRTGKVMLPDDEDEIEDFKYEEILPIALNGYTNLYEYETFCYTNLPVKICEGTLYRDGFRTLIFY